MAVMCILYITTLQAPYLNKPVGDRIKIEAKIKVLKDIAIDYRGKTIDNIIQQLEARLSALK